MDNEHTKRLSMPKTTIIQATEKDILSMHQLFIQCTDAMLAAGVKQWHYDYPFYIFKLFLTVPVIFKPLLHAKYIAIVHTKRMSLGVLEEQKS